MPFLTDALNYKKLKRLKTGLWGTSLSLCLVGALSGCSTSTKNLNAMGMGVSTVTEAEANVVVIRKSQWHSAGTGARLKLDGEELGYISSGRHIFLKVTPGPKTFEVDIKASFGSCSTQVEVKDSEPVYLEVKRMGALAGMFFGGVLGNDIAGAIESEKDGCQGVFQINQISRDETLGLMKDTKLGGFETGGISNL